MYRSKTFFSDVDQPRKCACSSSAGCAARQCSNNFVNQGMQRGGCSCGSGQQIFKNEVVRYQSQMPAVQTQAGPWWTRAEAVDPVVLPQTAPIYRQEIRQTAGPLVTYEGQQMGPMMTYESRNLSAADRSVYQRYLEEGRPLDVVNEVEEREKRGSKTSWSGRWRQTGSAYHVEQQVVPQQAMYVQSSPIEYVPYQTGQTRVIEYGGPSEMIGGPGGFYPGGGTQTRTIYGM